MTIETITPKNWIGKKKEGEVYRLQKFMAAKSLKPEDIQSVTGVTARTITNSIYENKPLGAKLLRELHSKYGVSVDWLISGVGNMFLTQNQVKETVHEYNSDAERLTRLSNELDLWMAVASEEEKIWLETDIKITLNRNWPPVIRNK